MPSDGNSRTQRTAPDPDELEISLFGPGYGECIVIHVGQGQWFIVDSCIDESGNPAALTYLSDIGVDPATGVILIVATHWHDDHMRGLHRIVESCPSAKFVCSDIFREEELMVLLSSYQNSGSALGSGVDEMTGVFTALFNRQNRDQFPTAVVANTCLWRSSDSSLHALSPSNYACIMAKMALKKALPSEGPVRRVPSLGPNAASVVLWLHCGQRCILLGADLEAERHPQMGWSCIVSSEARPDGRAGLYKVPHHGSSTAYDPQVWQRMLEPSAISILTPWSCGGRDLPTSNDLAALLGHTEHLYTTARTSRVAPLRRQSPVERTMNEVARNRRSILNKPGHICVRAPLNSTSQPQTYCTDGAFRVTAQCAGSCNGADRP